MENVGYFLLISLNTFIALTLSKEMGIYDHSLNTTLLWFLCLIITFMFGVYFGRLSEKNKQSLNQIKKERKIISDNLALLTSLNASSKDIETACWSVVTHEYTNKDNLFFVINYLADIKHQGNKYEKLINVALERLKTMQEKSQNT